MNYIVIDKNDTTSHYIVEDLQALISEMYSCELDNGETFEQVNQWFNETHTVFAVECNADKIKQIS